MRIWLAALLAASAIVLWSPTPTSAADGDAVWEMKQWSCEIDGDKAEVRTYLRLRVNRPQGDRYAARAFSESKFRKLEDLKIRITDATGAIIKEIDRDDLSKSCGFGASFQVYSDVCRYTFTSVGRSYPYRIEFRSRTKLESLFFVDGPTVIGDIPVERAVCSLVVPDEIPFRYKGYALPVELREELGKDNQRILVWEGDSLEPADPDTLATLEYLFRGELSIAIDKFKFIDAEYRGDTWSGIGRWYADILRKRDRIVRIGEAPPTRPFRDVLRDHFDRTTDQFRYVSVSIGVTGWLPRKPDDIAKTGYGDCKDLSLTLVNALREDGIEAYPALLLTRDDGVVDPDFPASRFNHVIAAAIDGSDTVWMDPTCRSCPLGVLPWADQHTEALMITDSGGILLQTPGSRPEENATVRHITIHIGGERRIKVTAAIEYTGVRAVYQRNRFGRLSTKERDDYFTSLLGSAASSFQIEKTTVAHLEDRYQPLQILIEAASKRPAPVIRNTVYLDPCVVDPAFGFDSDDFNRSRAIELRYPSLVLDSIRLTVDSGLTVDSLLLPEDTLYESSCGYFSVTRRSKDSVSGHLLIVIRRALSRFEIEVDRLAELESLTALSADQGARLVKIYIRD